MDERLAALLLVLRALEDAKALPPEIEIRIGAWGVTIDTRPGEAVVYAELWRLTDGRQRHFITGPHLNLWHALETLRKFVEGYRG